MVGCMKFAVLLVSCLPGLATDPVHIKIYEEAGRFGGWPANHGIWSWGDEILAGFSGAYFQSKPADRHQMDSARPEVPFQARSRDGGQTWTIERPPSLLPPEQGGPAARPLDQPMDFTAAGFAMSIKYADNHVGPSRLWYTLDRGRSWRGPYEMPAFGFPGIAARTDYIVDGKRDAMVFLTAAKADRREGRPIVVRTTDGGLAWKLVATIGPEPPGFSIMPSSLRLGAGTLLTTVRVKHEPHNWIEQYRSEDNGANWKSEGRIADTGARSGNPPHLIRLAGGRLCLTYGYRSEPYSIRGKLSADEGRTWSPERTLRDGAAAWDLGYVRSVQRPDGKVVSVYYFNDAPHRERFIAATIWDPGK
jgi:hypothetical protein